MVTAGDLFRFENVAANYWSLFRSSTTRGRRSLNLAHRCRRHSVMFPSRDLGIGFRAGSVERLRGMLPFAERASPSVVLIDVGTNDLSSPSVNPGRLDCEIGELARLFRQLQSVEAVVIMPILAWWSTVSIRRDYISMMRVLT